MSKSIPFHPIMIRAPQQVYEALQDEARAKGTTVSALCRDLVTAAMQPQETHG